MYSCLGYLVVFLAVEKHRASKNVGELEERLLDVRHWDLHKNDKVSCGRPHSYRESLLEQGVTSCKVKQRARESTNKLQGPLEKETAEKRASTCRAAKKRGGEGAAITHWPHRSEPAGWLER